MKLNELSDNPGAVKDRKRVGRGIGSGKGKTAGRGVKGQKARAGVRVKGFEGGQMPLHRRLPKRGFTNIFRVELATVSLERIQTAIDAGKLDPKALIDGAALVKSGILRRLKGGVKILGNGELKAKKLAFEVAAASASALKAIEEGGGSVKLLTPVAPTEA